LTQCHLVAPTNGLRYIICAALIQRSSTLPRVQHSLPYSSDSLLTALGKLSDLSSLVFQNFFLMFHLIQYNLLKTLKSLLLFCRQSKSLMCDSFKLPNYFSFNDPFFISLEDHKDHKDVIIRPGTSKLESWKIVVNHPLCILWSIFRNKCTYEHT
jgi:hypothetical protein